MKCGVFGCITHYTHPTNGEIVWYNYCPVCNSRLDR